MQVEQGKAAMGHLVGSADPTKHRPMMPHQCHLTNLCEWPRSTLSSSSHHWLQVSSKSNAQKRHYMDVWTHHGYVGAQMDLGDSYPCYHACLGPPHRRRRAHSSVGGRPTPRGSPDTPLPPNQLSFGQHANKHKIEQSHALV